MTISSTIERVRAVLPSFGRTGGTTDEIMLAAKDDRPAVYGALNKMLKNGEVQRGGSGRTGPIGRKAVRWRLKPVSVGG